MGSLHVVHPRVLGSSWCRLWFPQYLLALLTLSTQASAAYPENTIASFQAAIRDGAEGIESGIYAVATPSVSRNHFGRRPRLSGQHPYYVS